MALHGFRYRLRWSDFKKISRSPDPGSDAYTACEISAKYAIATKSNGDWSVTKVDVVVSVTRPQSWVVEGKESNALLKHEQAHYDIAAIAGRTLEAKLSKLKGSKQDHWRKAVDKASQEIIGERTPDGRTVSKGLAQEVQDRYDEDAICGSDHSRNAVNQAVWEHRISAALLSRTISISELDSCPRPNSRVPAD
jgi:hypothetical protein